MKTRLRHAAFIASAAVLLFLALATASLASYHAGTRHTDTAGVAKALSGLDITQGTHKDSSTYGPNINFGSFTIAGTVKAAAKAGLVLQSSGGNLIHVLIDRHSSIVLPSGKRLTTSQLEKGNTVSVVARVTPGGQFLALRIIQE